MQRSTQRLKLQGVAGLAMRIHCIKRNEMTTIKTWQTRKAECLAEFPHSEAFDYEHMDAEITDLRAAVDRKDALLRKLKDYFPKRSYSVAAINKELS
jgi:uncharacterized protein (DUF305 family)